MKNRPSKQRKVCPEGHVFYKSSDCLSCPTCEAGFKPQSTLLSAVAAPARRALLSRGIFEPEHLSQYTEEDVLSWHGIGPGAFYKISEVLKSAGFSFSRKP